MSFSDRRRTRAAIQPSPEDGFAIASWRELFSAELVAEE
jgi:hypothetical protein